MKRIISKKDFLICVYNAYYNNDIDYLKNLQSAISLIIYYKENGSEESLNQYIDNTKGLIQL